MQRLSPQVIALITITVIVAVTVAIIIMIWANTPDNRPERSPAESSTYVLDFAHSSTAKGPYLLF